MVIEPQGCRGEIFGYGGIHGGITAVFTAVKALT